MIDISILFVCSDQHESLLNSIYTKLGFSTRVELAMRFHIEKFYADRNLKKGAMVN